MSIHDLEKSSYGCWFNDMPEQLKQHIYGRSEEAFTAGDAARDDIKSKERLEEHQTIMRNKFIKALGGLPDCSIPLNPRITGTLDCDGFKVEKVIFEARPKVFVTANLYIPDGIESPRGAVLFLCGHFEQAKQADEYQVVCQFLVRSGLVVLAQDPIGQGERMGYYEKSINTTTVAWGTYEHDYAGNQCWPLGNTIAKYFLHDAMRGIDYLCTRPEVDPARIGVTGNSGGGLQTAMLMAYDQRIAAAAPTTFIMNRKTNMYTGIAQDAEQIWPGLTADGYDHEDILLAMVPRPVLVLAVKYDFFPIEGTRRTVERTGRFWEMYGKGDCIMLFEDDVEHHYTRRMARAVSEFFSLHLLGKKYIPDDDSAKAIDPSLLWCTESGQVRGEIARACSVYEENCVRLTEMERLRNSIPAEEKRKKAFKWLKDKVFSNRMICDPNSRFFIKQTVNDLLVQSAIWWSQENLNNHAYMFRDYRYAGMKLPVTIAVWADGTKDLQSHLGWIRRICSTGRAVMVLDVSGEGHLEPRPVNGNPPKAFLGVISKFVHDLIWIDDSLAAMRIYDVIRAVDVAGLWPGIDGKDIQLYCYGLHGVYGRLAAFLDERIDKVEVSEGMERYADWIGARHYDEYDIMSIIIPGMLQYFDLPDIDLWMGID